MHDGLPLWREKYSRSWLSLSRRKTRGSDLSRNQGGQRSAARWRWRQLRWKCWIRRGDGEVHGLDWAAAAALHLPWGGLLRFVAVHYGASVPAQGKRLVAGRQQSVGPTRDPQLPIPDRSPHPGLLAGSIAGRGHRLRHLY